MTWVDEVRDMVQEARGDLAVLAALMALRKVENGPPGNEFGVLSIASADTWAEELRVAATSLRNRERACRDNGMATRDDHGFFTEAFLMVFSRRWAPPGAENDPNGLNAHHVQNLVALNQRYAGRALAALRALA